MAKDSPRGRAADASLLARALACALAIAGQKRSCDSRWVLSVGEQSPAWLTGLDQHLRRRVRSRQGGMPDVVAWDEDAPLATALFVECKGASERLSEAQEDWVAAAINVGVAVSQIAVSLR